MKTFCSAWRLHKAFIFVLCLFFPFFCSCGDDDDEGNGWGGGSSKSDFIEVNLQGKTYHGTMPVGTYATIDLDYGLTFGYTIMNPEAFNDFEVYYGLVYPTNLNELADCKPGDYAVVTNPINSYDESQLLDFVLQMEMSNGDPYEAVSGVNKVTQVTDKGNYAVVEGKFTAKMSNENYETDLEQRHTFNMTGRYKITVQP